MSRDPQKEWALKRIDNMRRLQKEALTDDVVLFTQASMFLSDLAHLQSKMGDDEAGMYIGVLANSLFTKARRMKKLAQEGPKKTKRAR